MSKSETIERRKSYGVPKNATHINPETHMYYRKFDGIWNVWFGSRNEWYESHSMPRLLHLLQKIER